MTEKTSDKPQNISNLLFKLALVLILLVVIGIHLGLEKVVNIVIVLAGFGAVIFVHELGHFLAARAVGIKIEAFSLGFGPVFIGLTRAAGRWHTRILPDFSQKDDPSAKQADGTEYRLSLIPLGGYVKMMGQEDLAADKPSDDPGSFVNKTVLQRMFVISAGVIMNIICGALVFMLVFAHGVDLSPAVAGLVADDSPAQKAGIQPGDEILSIDGKTRITFMDVKIAGAFTEPGQMRQFNVRHPDGTTQTLPVTVGEEKGPDGLRYFGIVPPVSLQIANDLEGVSKKEFTQELPKDGLKPGWRIVAINDQSVSRYDQIFDVLHPDLDSTPDRSISLTLAENEKSADVVKVNVNLKLGSLSSDGHVFGLTPRMKLLSVQEKSPAEKAGLKKGDILLAVGGVKNPTFEDLRKQCLEHNDKPLEFRVLRVADDKQEELTLSATPQRVRLWQIKQLFLNEKQREQYLSPMIGVAPGQDLAHAVVAKAVAPMKDMEPPAIPPGATMVSVAAQPVENYEDIFTALRDHRGGEVEVVYRWEGEDQKLTIKVPHEIKWTSAMAWDPDWQNKYNLPLLNLQRTIKGDNLLDALAWGYECTAGNVAQTYAFIRGMLTRQVSATAASGPVGILSVSYSIASQRTFSFFFYFMAIISVCVAVFNFLPLPVLDGGYVVMLMIEKIKGSPVPVKVQEYITYAGLALLLVFVLYVTRSDIARLIIG